MRLIYLILILLLIGILTCSDDDEKVDVSGSDTAVVGTDTIDVDGTDVVVDGTDVVVDGSDTEGSDTNL